MDLERVDMEMPERQRRTAIARHPNFAEIEALLRRGKSARWIEAWLKQQYPIEDEWGQPHPDGLTNRKLHISASTINEYRREWMPEYTPGVDVVHEGLEKIIGHRMPADRSGFELDVMEVAITVAQHNLAKALEQDEETGMLQPITLEAQDRLVDAAKTRVELAQKLSAPGYEAAAQKLQIHAETRNLHVNVDANGPRANEPDKLKVMRQLLAQGPERAREIIHAAEDVVQGHAVDIDET